MRIQLFSVVLASMIGVAAVAPASAEYRRIVEGPSLDYALAYCDNASMGVGRSHFVFGDPSFVAGAMIGVGIRRMIDRSRFKESCMVMQGWKWVPDAPSASAPAQRPLHQGQGGCTREQLRQSPSVRGIC